MPAPHTLLALLGLTLAGMPVHADDGLPPDSTAAAPLLFDFEMEDQFDEIHRRTDYTDRVLVVIGSGKGGSEWNRLWGGAIRDSLESSGLDQEADRVGVADVRGVPFFIKGMVKGKFPKDPEEWALVDWKGEFAQRYGWTKGEANVLVFGADGRLTAQAHGLEPPDSEIRRILAAIEAAVVAAGSEELAAPPTAAEATGSGADRLD